MLGLPLWRRHRAPRLSLRRGLALLHGRALYLPPAAIGRRAYPPRHTLSAALRPFQERLYYQRAGITVLRALTVAAMVATITLLLRLYGLALPLPLTPIIAAGSTFILCLCTIPWQRPSTPQVAHTLDGRLGLREQIGSALDVDENGGRLTTLLQERANATLRSTQPSHILPWPSLTWERRRLILVAVVTGVTSLMAKNAPPPGQATAAHNAQALTTIARGARTTGSRTHAAQPRALPLKIVSVGSALRGQHATPPRGQRATGLPGAERGTGTGTAGGTRVVPGRTAAGAGHATRTTGRPETPGNGAGTTASLNGQAGHGTLPRLTVGGNSASAGAGGSDTSQQQALRDLQRSILTAQQGQPGQKGESRTATGLSHGNQGHGQGRGRSGGGARGRNGSGTDGRGRTGHSATGGRGTGQGRARGSNHSGSSGGASNNSMSGSGHSPDGGDPTSLRRFGQAGSGAGLNRGATGQDTTLRGMGQARLSANTAVTLDGKPGTSNRLSISLGGHQRTSGTSNNAMYGDGTSAPVTVPGYVAPDSNAVPPDDRAVIQSYFSPPVTSG